MKKIAYFCLKPINSLMTIKISDQLINQIGMTNQELMLELAIMLFQEEKVTLALASQVANLHQMPFQKELAKRKIPIHYGIEEFDEDMKTLEKLNLI